MSGHIDKPLYHDYMRQHTSATCFPKAVSRKRYQSGAWAKGPWNSIKSVISSTRAETLNFTAAARLSGVSQPSLTRAIRRLEDELGGPLIYRDGKNSRLTGLGHDVEAEFRRMVVAMKSVRNHSGTGRWGAPRAGCRRRAHRRTKEFTAFFESALAEMPSIEIKLHSLQSNEGHIGGAFRKYHACIMPRETRPERKLDVHPLFRERFVLGCSANHPLAPTRSCAAKTCSSFLSSIAWKCEFRDRILDHFARRDLLTRPRFPIRSRGLVQRVVADGHAMHSSGTIADRARPRHSADRRICLGARSRDRDSIRLHGNGRDTEHRAAGSPV